MWFKFILSLNFIFFCFKLIIIHYHIQKQKKVKFKPRIKLIICAVKLFTLVKARSSFGREFQSLGAATIKALSPNVFDRTAGIESKIPSEDTLKKKTFT